MKQLYIVYSQENNVICIVDNIQDEEYLMNVVSDFYDVKFLAIQRYPGNSAKEVRFKLHGWEFDAPVLYSIILQQVELKSDPEEYNPGPEGNDSKTHALIMGINFNTLREQISDLSSVFEPDHSRACQGVASLLSSLQEAVVLDGLVSKEEVLGAKAGE